MKREMLIFLLVAFTGFMALPLKAQWEPTGFSKAAWVLCRAENGNLIVADDNYPDMGGIYLSRDKGVTWEKTNAADFSYTSRLVKDENIYMGGVDCNVAISHDNGETWENVNFKELYPEASEYDPIYAMEYHNGRVYASVLYFGIAYSEDGGVTWVPTDRESLLDEDDPENGGQWCYSLRSYKGKLYDIGAFGIWEYDEDADLWTKVDDRWYAARTCIANDVLYITYNAPGLPEAIRYTTDFQEWGSMPIPEGVTTSIRTMEYYQGAFFLGHVEQAVFYTLDQGITWVEYRDNFPAFSPVPGVNFYGVPMGFVFDGDQIFCGVFSTYDIGGVYRAPVPDEITGVKKMETQQKTVVYPNPASDYVLIHLPEETKGPVSLLITDVMGREMYGKAINNAKDNLLQVSVEDWALGLYLYTITNGESKIAGKILVK